MLALNRENVGNLDMHFSNGIKTKSLLIINIHNELSVFVNCIIPFTMNFMS